MTMTTDLGSMIARERLARGWSLREMTRRGGPPHNTLSLIESGKSHPDPTTLWKIAGVYADERETVGSWFARLLRAAGYPIDNAEDAAVARVVSVLSSGSRDAFRGMSADDLETLVSLYVRMRRGHEPAE